jgi:two-component sensor histidine kinase
LILNELVTNAAKHAFSDGQGNIEVNIHEDDDGRVTVSDSDDGVGIPEGIDIQETTEWDTPSLIDWFVSFRPH